MSDLEAYSAYLKGRTLKGLAYRRWFLYPRLARELEGRVLDIGCGIGDFLAFRKNTVGTDINPALVSQCRNRGLVADLMPYDKLPYPERAFDGAVLDNVLEHIAEPDPLLSEVRRVMVPNGTLIVGVPGEKGFASDLDHKVFYDEINLRSTLELHHFKLRRLLHMPMRSKFLARRMKQYCLYAIFERS